MPQKKQAALPSPPNRFPPDSAAAALRTLLASLDVEGLLGADVAGNRNASPVCIVPNRAGRGLELTSCDHADEFAGAHLRIYADGRIAFVSADGDAEVAR